MNEQNNNSRRAAISERANPYWVIPLDPLLRLRRLLVLLLLLQHCEARSETERGIVTPAGPRDVQTDSRRSGSSGEKAKPSSLGLACLLVTFTTTSFVT